MGVLLLGPVVVEPGSGLSPRERVVVSALAVRLGRVVSSGELADAVWGDRPPSTWPKQVQASVGLIRRVLRPGAIETTSSGYRLMLEPDELDVQRFEGLVSRARVLAAAGEFDRAAPTFERALGLWRGAPFGELPMWPPGVSEVARLEELRRGVEEDLLEARLASGDHREVAAAAEALISAEPLRERRWAILALAQYRCGRQGDALRTLQRARRTLVEQLGVDPGRELGILEAAILGQDPTLDVDITITSVSDDCPYKGLAAYDVDDRESFFGRDTQIAACLERMGSTPLLVVTGASGCGKSSLVRAGLATELVRSGRRLIVIVPGAQPVAELARAVASVDEHGTLIVDQFEELFAVSPPEVAREFCGVVVAHAARARVILTIRADHLTSLVADPSIGPLVERSLHFVTPLAGDELRAAIEEPARQAGLRVEHGLVDLMIRDADGEPGALPMLSHALVETWRRRDGNVLTVEGYRASGGIRGAVARTADRLYDSLPPEQRPLVRALMLRLVYPSLEGEPMRCRVPVDTLRGDPDRERVLGLLVGARLITTEEDTVELAHESLARAWPRLRSWIDDDTAGHRIMRHLAAAAVGWDSLGRPDSEVYRGARLESAIEYRDHAQPDLTGVEVAFLDASQRRGNAERDSAVERARLDARRNRRLRVSLVAVMALLVVSLVAVTIAVRNARVAGDQRDVARDAVDEAELEALVNRSLALRPTDRDVAALLAVEAARRWPNDPRATAALMGTFTAAEGFLGYHHVADAQWLDGALVSGTSLAVIAVDGERLALFDLTNDTLEERFPASVDDAGSVIEVRVSGDGRFVVDLRFTPDGGSCYDLEVLQRTDGHGCAQFSVYDVSTGQRVLEPVTPPFGRGAVAINDDGSLVAVTGGYEGDIALYRTSDGTQVGTLPGLSRPEGAIQSRDSAAVAFGPDGRLYVGSMAGPIRIVDPHSLDVIGRIDAPEFSSNEHLEIGRDGLVVGGGNEALVAADATSGTRRWLVDIRGTSPDPCPWFAVSETSGRMYCGNNFGVIEERERSTGQRTGLILDPQLGPVGTLALDASGHELVAFGDQEPVISRWRLDGDGLVTTRIADGHVVADGYDFVDGSTLVVAARSAAATFDVDLTDWALWDVAGDRPVEPLDFAEEGIGWAGRDVLIGAAGVTAAVDDAGVGDSGVPEDPTVVWYDTRSRSVVGGVDIPIGGDVECVHSWPSAGGERLYCGFDDGDVWTIDTATRQRIEPTMHVGDAPTSVSATRGGSKVVVTAFVDGEAVTTVFDGTTGAQLGQPLVGPNLTNVSLDGVLVGATGGAVMRYDVDTLRPLATLPGARGEITTIQFSDDGATLLLTSLDQTVAIYDVATGTRLGDPIPSEAPFIFAGYLRRDGRAVAITERTGIVIWDLDPDHLRDAACKLAGRNLTFAEWDTYVDQLHVRQRTCPDYP